MSIRRNLVELEETSQHAVLLSRFQKAIAEEAVKARAEQAVKAAESAMADLLKSNRELSQHSLTRTHAFKCQKCGATFENETELVEHLQS